MPTAQEARQASVRAATGTAYTYEEDWLALFADAGITSGDYNERLLAWINLYLTTTYRNINDAMLAFAKSQGYGSWDQMGVFDVYNSSADAYFSALPDAEPTPVKAIVNAFIVGLKADGLWSNIDGGNILCIGTADNCLVDFRNPSRVGTLAPGWTGTFTPYRGVNGSGATIANQTDYIDTGFVPSTAGGVMTRDSAHIAVFSRSSGANNNLMMGANSGHDNYVLPRNSSNQTVGRSNNATNDIFLPATTDGSGLFLVSRTGAAETKAYRNGVAGSVITTPSTGLPDVSIRYLQLQGAAATLNQAALGCYGAGLNAQEAANLDARVQALIGALTVM